MQGVVRVYDPQTGEGVVVRDTDRAELVLAPSAADAAHPAFSKLFVQTEYHAKAGALLATRRRRSPGEPEIWAAHLAVLEGETVGEPEIETDRARFLGRGREVRTPMAVVDGLPLSNTAGAVLDAETIVPVGPVEGAPRGELERPGHVVHLKAFAQREWIRSHSCHVLLDHLERAEAPGG